MSERRAQRRLAAIVSADVVGYSRMMGADEEGTLARLNALRAEFLHPKISEYGGRIVKLMGDGTLIECASAVDAVALAAAVQRGLAERNRDLPEAQRIMLRFGINVGDIIIDGEDVYGDGVNVAARLESIADPGGIYVSAGVRDYAGGRLELGFEDLGPRELKNIAEPVRVFRVDLGEIAQPTLPVSAAAAANAVDRPSIAVLPFDSYAADDEQEAFADGMTEDLTTDLSKIAGLFVVARNSAQAFRGRSSDMKAVARSLGVRYLLEGSVRKAGARVRINAQLIDAQDGGHLWADRFDGTVDDVFELQDEVSAKVVEALSVRLSEGEKVSLGKVHANNLEAYELFVRAKATPYPPIPERINAAREMFETVIDMDPDFAGGYAGAAMMIGFAAMWGGYGDVQPVVVRAEELARQAIALDETFAWSYTALGFALFQQRRYDEGIAAARRTIELQPSDADGHAYLGHLVAMSGHYAEAEVHLKEAIRLNPRFFGGPYWNMLGLAQSFAGQYEAAIDALETNIRQKGPLGPPAFCSRIVAYQGLGEHDKAAAIANELRAAYPQLVVAGWNFVSLIQPEQNRLRYVQLLEDAGVR